MPPRLYSLFLFLFTFAGIAFLSWTSKVDRLRETPRMEAANPRALLPEMESSNRQESTAAAREITPVGNSALTPSAPLLLSPEASLALAEEIEWRTLGAAAGLELNDAQWRALTEVTRLHQAIRWAYEAEIAVVTTSDDTHSQVLIPTYAEAGETLRDEFFMALREVLGGELAQEVFRKLGRDLEARFGGFGVAVQTVDLVVDQGGKIATSLTRTALYWDGSDELALATRRETHLPQWEEFSRETWEPLLARVEQAYARKARG